MMLSLLILNKVACVRVLYRRRFLFLDHTWDAESAAAAWVCGLAAAAAAAVRVDSLMIDGIPMLDYRVIAPIMIDRGSDRDVCRPANYVSSGMIDRLTHRWAAVDSRGRIGVRTFVAPAE